MWGPDLSPIISSSICSTDIYRWPGLESVPLSVPRTYNSRLGALIALRTDRRFQTPFDAFVKRCAARMGRWLAEQNVHPTCEVSSRKHLHYRLSRLADLDLLTSRISPGRPLRQNAVRVIVFVSHLWPLFLPRRTGKPFSTVSILGQCSWCRLYSRKDSFLQFRDLLPYLRSTWNPLYPRRQL